MIFHWEFWKLAVQIFYFWMGLKFGEVNTPTHRFNLGITQHNTLDWKAMKWSPHALQNKSSSLASLTPIQESTYMGSVNALTSVKITWINSLHCHRISSTQASNRVQRRSRCSLALCGPESRDFMSGFPFVISTFLSSCSIRPQVRWDNRSPHVSATL